MAYLLIRHKVTDVDKWMPLFKGHRPTREAAGLKDLHVWKNEGSPNEVVVLFEAADEAKAKKFAESSDLKQTMEKAGVQGPPDIAFLAEL